MARDAAPNVDAYITSLDESKRPVAKEMRALIRGSAPEAEERISWAMPTYKLKGENLIHFAVHTNHISIYPGAEAMEVFAPRLEGYKTSKGALQFPLGKPLPAELIVEFVKWRVERVLAEKIK